MPNQRYSGAQIRQTFIDYFVARGHTFVPSSSLVPGGDQTLLFTNAGMVQFKDVFLGIDKRPYTRATNSQKCMRVAGKHNDLEDVGRDDTHHTFFEMLGNWSFGDYYKKEAIAWAWDLLTNVWGLPKERLWATCFEDEKGEIERDDEAAQHWLQQPGFEPSHLLFFGRKDNFWEMAETGPCGPCSEIHYDRGPAYCDRRHEPGHICGVNQGCARFLELWNLVFIQYNRLDAQTLEPLPAKHVDTGMGLERVVSILQDVDSNYKTDLLSPMMDAIQQLTGHSDEERMAHITPYRVIADHARAAAFLIADGVIPGNTGRNYVCRMIIRRAARFGSKIGLHEPFIAKIADSVIANYGDFYQELRRNRTAILDNLTREETRFQRTVEAGVAKLETLLEHLRDEGKQVLPGEQAFDLYATYGLPLEITRDIAREQQLEVDEEGFHRALEAHRLASATGETFATFGEEDVELYRHLAADLQAQGKLSSQGVNYDPYGPLQVEGQILALVQEGRVVEQAQLGTKVEVLLPSTCFYVESGGQVSDSGVIRGQEWEIRVEEMRKPAAGVIVHLGEVIRGTPRIGDECIAQVDVQRRRDIMRNHTATHLLHAELRAVLGEHVRQAGSLVAPDRLRFDFTHPEPLSKEQLVQIEANVNDRILENHPLYIEFKPLQQAISEGAMALFGEKYADTVRTISIKAKGIEEITEKRLAPALSYELCGGTHVDETGDIGLFLITNEGSVGAGLRRIEAVTGRGAYEFVQRRLGLLNQISNSLDTIPEQLPEKVDSLLNEIAELRKQNNALRRTLVTDEFNRRLEQVPIVNGIAVLTAILPDANADTLRQMADRFRQRYHSGVAVLASVEDRRPLIIVTVTEDLTKRGIHAGELAKTIALPLEGSGGGRPTLAQAGGKNASKLESAMAEAKHWIEQKLRLSTK